MKNRKEQVCDEIDVRILSDSDALWEEIDLAQSFSVYHTIIWRRIIEETFGHVGIYITASKDGALIDALPFFLIKNYFLGKKLVSTPYEACNGGFSSSQVEVRKALIERILKYAQKSKVRYIELRSRFPINQLKEFGFIEKRPFVISEVPLIDIDKNWEMLSRNHRRNVRISRKKGLSVVPATRWSEMKLFYRILFDHNRNLGIPFFSEIFFKQIWEKLIQNDHASLLLAKLKEEVIGGHLLFFSGKTLISKYSARKKDKEFSKLYPSYALFWEGIRLGIINNFANFRLGVTGQSDTGLLDFKSRFGSKISPIYFYYYPIRGKLPAFDKYYSGFSLLKKIWSATPTILTSPIGQKINEWIC
jgi:hypothetical protein